MLLSKLFSNPANAKKFTDLCKKHFGRGIYHSYKFNFELKEKKFLYLKINADILNAFTNINFFICHFILLSFK